MTDAPHSHRHDWSADELPVMDEAFWDARYREADAIWSGNPNPQLISEATDLRPAQQTASEVERRIVSNSSVKVVGRLDPAEAGRPEYGFLPPSQRARATLAKPGTMFVSQPEIPVPLAVEFPFPAWATRLSEVSGPIVAPATTGNGHANGSGNGARPRDPFARLPAVPTDDDAPF